MKNKILILGNSNLTVFGFRGELIDKLIKNGYEIITVFPNGPFGNGEKIAKEHKCKFIEINLDRRGTNPFSDLKLLKNYKKIIKNEKPDIVLSFTVKCDIYGGIACRILNIPFYPNVTGLGKGLTEGNITKIITKKLYKISFKKAKVVFFQNNTDKDFFIDNKLFNGKSVVLPGSGVNLNKYKPLEYPKNKTIKFIYVARLMKTKGIEQYLNAAKYFRKKKKKIEFHICGYCEEDYKEKIKQYEDKNYIIYHGLVDNIIDFEKDCNCLVLPSFHPEGISNVLLEAAACARPIITTTRVGCKETIIDKKTGYLIEPKSTKDLIDKINKFINLSYSEMKNMGLEGRKYIEKNFDRNIVIEKYIEEIEG